MRIPDGMKRPDMTLIYPVRRRRDKADLAGLAQYHHRLGTAGSRLEAGHEPIRYPLSGTVHQAFCVIPKPALNTEFLTLPRLPNRPVGQP